MRLLSQKIAQRANHDDNEVGKFWQARYRAVRLLDETAILSCAAYVDLNPIRAAMAQTIETSEFTSAQQRALELRESLRLESPQEERIASFAKRESTSSTVSSAKENLLSSKPIAKSLCPLSLDELSKQRRANKGEQTKESKQTCQESLFDSS